MQQFSFALNVTNFSSKLLDNYRFSKLIKQFLKSLKKMAIMHNDRQLFRDKGSIKEIKDLLINPPYILFFESQ